MGRAKALGGKTSAKLFSQSLASALLVLSLAGYARAQSAATEYEIKAAFLYNFARFVEWPQQSFTSAAAPFQICVLGQDPFGQSLRQIARDKQVNGHPFEIKNVTDTGEARACQILFISLSEKKRLREILLGLRGASVLTVGESKDFAEQGGMINFVLESERVHFEVNLRAAEQAGLKISSKLLSLARNVEV